ncbi:hypothetical protein [Pseudobacteriovorax antillogorgiicola]|uniref:Uncharacterized protein n=1 Tax=Pseudobacteriovorax antillogorgiicola TaxID=1513793 RepID=A0A1Y6CFE4_9BACT|nr:hypothetical protein [Pseudobacteriovorax antillogorgiicola]TCS47586.1 hypothetical protein EDD56_12027 [Pseudobacteriovorax antillogorgiicola]SMF60285.1 hypothetical protein SAMN06296036_120113 [Pseudobacteriovorax antillogorgiicola]
MFRMVMVGFGLLVVFFVYRFNSDKARPTAPIKQPLKKPTISKVRDVGKERKVALKRQQKIVRLENAIGLSPMTLPAKDGQQWVKVRIEPLVKRCQVGDYDLIGLDQSYHKKPNIILSLEDLSQPGASRSNIKPVKLKDLKEGFVHRFPLPKNLDHGHFGIFLCQDSSRRGYCHNKKLDSMSGLLDWHRDAVAGKRAYPRKDRIYLFQSFLKDGPMAKMIDHTVMDAKHYKAMAKLIKLRQGGSGSNQAAFSAKSHRQLGSIPARMDGDTMIITIPRNDPSCKIFGLL